MSRAADRARNRARNQAPDPAQPPPPAGAPTAGAPTSAPPAGAPTLLETRFRTVLRVLPAYYRREREEEMVDTFLSDCEPLDEEIAFGRPGFREVTGVLALAVRSRLAGPEAPGRYAAYGRTARLVALFGVVALASVVLVGLLTDLAVLLAGSPFDRRLVLDALTGAAASGYGATAWSVATYVLPLGWIGACVALLAGRPRTAGPLAVGAALPQVVAVVRGLDGSPLLGLTAASAALPCLVVAATLSAFPPGAPRPEISGRVVEWLPPACLPVALASYLVGRHTPVFQDWAYGWTFLTAGALWLVLRARAARSPARPARSVPPDPAVPSALAVLGLPVLALGVVNLAFLVQAGAGAEGSPFAGAITVNAVQTGSIAVLEAVLLAAGLRALRREPRTRPPLPA
ncbi:hypothetical protein PUR57_39135 [Streptomyces sp. JV176]|uniref:hypothetical protein n=1 Tax=Streptomyces sp. JV176 TaxID=858630 RepID=UPI002E78D171|nr:hypothetical protein [Streptomyces sp. JV176]MEE1804628.1 hypothetical protein [Streptomyces sp. JV176]